MKANEHHVHQVMERIGLEEQKQYSKRQAEDIINQHVLSLYKGGMRITENRMYSGYEIGEKIATVDGNFSEAIDRVSQRNKKCQNF